MEPDGVEQIGEMYEGLPEDDSLLPRGSRRRDVSALKRGPQHATAADDGEEGDPCDGGGPDRSRAKQPPVISIAQKAMAVVFVVTCCYLLASSGLRDDARAHTPPKFSAYVSGKPDSLEGALGALFALQAPAAGSCAVGVSRVACQLDASAALALSLEHRAHALGALMPCWALFRLPQHAGAQRVVVLRGGLRLGGGAFAPALLDAMGADVLLPSSRAPPGGASAYLQPDPCAAHYVRKGPPRSGWPLQGAPAVDLAAVDQREASLLPPTLLGVRA
ncbi:hypothetical protein T492DRAFT_905586 [Pavlovales sp. CCMP2436]|nr:hypothetical protein T492DRAFT_905586 [Pavlovales sp. CCMP2436]